ncbi:hypothetical protein NLJ89_g11967 [Agrocybe chaxingu]|uniref:Uncharacterized protein n=1 Tax=Agrocybe chaxingu TaxID=84603 RepID=A0A9W8MNX7_9AGAR|nr:hypothetical protein NLJ89_g11967 [Agrocybe chaxingu]
MPTSDDILAAEQEMDEMEKGIQDFLDRKRRQERDAASSSQKSAQAKSKHGKKQSDGTDAGKRPVVQDVATPANKRKKPSNASVAKGKKADDVGGHARVARKGTAREASEQGLAESAAHLERSSYHLGFEDPEEDIDVPASVKEHLKAIRWALASSVNTQISAATDLTNIMRHIVKVKGRVDHTEELADGIPGISEELANMRNNIRALTDVVKSGEERSNYYGKQLQRIEDTLEMIIDCSNKREEIEEQRARKKRALEAEDDDECE